MLKKSIMMTAGSCLFVTGMITFPLPVPIGLPLMIIGGSLMMKSSNQLKRALVRLTKKHHPTHQAWIKVRNLVKQRNRI